jgi:hypothetical protein
VAITILFDMNGVSSSLISASRRRVTLKTSLLHWWDLAESVATLNDQHGSLNLTRTGTLNTESTLAPDGGSCVSNPATGYFLADNVPRMAGFTTGFSVNIWARRTSNSSTGNFFVSHRNDPAGSGRYFQINRSNSNALQNHSIINSTAIQNATSAATDLNVWTMLTLVSDASTINSYQNGVLASTTARSGTADTANAAFAFFTGSFLPGFSAIYHLGQLFACGIWSRALAQNDITNLYNSGAGRRYISL